MLRMMLIKHLRKTNTKSKKQEKNWITEEELNDVLEYQKSFDIQKYMLLRLYMATH